MWISRLDQYAPCPAFGRREESGGSEGGSYRDQGITAVKGRRSVKLDNAGRDLIEKVSMVRCASSSSTSFTASNVMPQSNPHRLDPRCTLQARRGETNPGLPVNVGYRGGFDSRRVERFLLEAQAGMRAHTVNRIIPMFLIRESARRPTRGARRRPVMLQRPAKGSGTKE